MPSAVSSMWHTLNKVSLLLLFQLLILIVLLSLLPQASCWTLRLGPAFKDNSEKEKHGNVMIRCALRKLCAVMAVLYDSKKDFPQGRAQEGMTGWKPIR